MKDDYVSASDALEKLEAGNLSYLNLEIGSGDISREKRIQTSKEGQKPYAVIITCSDSRVIPESIFSAGIGELFVVRVAGNVIDNYQLGSIEYAIEHLGCRLVVVLGHTQCGAVSAATHKNKGYISYITDEIKQAIGEETDPIKACILNIERSVAKIQKSLDTVDGLQIIGALYHTDSGVVDFEIN
ncbi:MAG: carbonic anhydrase [Clostridia bacterium]|nr:carbonic anhydrase [Clostridia bacterium]